MLKVFAARVLHQTGLLSKKSIPLASMFLPLGSYFWQWLRKSK